MGEPVKRKDIHIGFTVATIAISAVAYFYTTFASVDYVKSYVDTRHEQVLKKLDDIDKKLDNLDQKIWSDRK